MRKKASRCVIGLLMVALLLPARADIVATTAVSDQPVAVQGGVAEEVQPKFVFFAFLLNVALKFAIASFREWRHQQLTSDVAQPVNYKKLLRDSTLTSLVSTMGGGLLPIFGVKSADAVAIPEQQGDRNDNRPADFHGAHVAVIGFDARGNVTGLRPLDAVFRSGERIKLKVVSTFDAWFVLENIGATGARQQVFPRQADQAVLLQAGSEIVAPMVEDQFLEFTGEAGREQLVLTFRDPKAGADTASSAQVVRQVEREGVDLLQEVAPGKFPVFTETLTLRHER